MKQEITASASGCSRTSLFSGMGFFALCLLLLLSFVPNLSSAQVSGCVPPTSPMVGGVNDHAAIIRWEGTPQDVRLRWNIVNDNVYHYDTVNSNYYILDSLAPATSYAVRITSGCSANMSSNLTVLTTAVGVVGEMSYTDYLPVATDWNYSISEQMWLASELDDYGDTIRGISFLGSAPTASPRSLRIWIVDTSLANLSTTQYVPSTSMTLVFDDTMTLRAGINYFAFSAPYVRDVTKNIVLLMTDNTNDWDDYNGWIVGPSSVSSLYEASDDAPFSTTNLSTLDPIAMRAAAIFDATFVGQLCQAPLVGVDMTDSGAVVSWLPGGQDSVWTVEYKLAGSSTWTTAVASTTLTTATISSLPPATRCLIRVGAICGNDVYYDTMQVYTPCGVLQLPYYEDVSPASGYSGAFNLCWHGMPDVNNTFPYFYITDVLGLNGGGYIITPELPVDATQLQFVFDWNAQSSNTRALVGVCPHAADLDSMQVVDTLLFTQAGYVEQMVNFSNCDTSFRHLFILTQGYYSMFDNFRIIGASTCLPPDSMWVDSLVGNDAYLAWHPSPGVAGYTVNYTLVGRDSTRSITTVDTTLVLQGLEPRSTYTANVSVICQEGDGPVAPSSTLVFNTGCSPVASLPYYEDFENCVLTDASLLPPCWAKYYVRTDPWGGDANKVVEHSSYASSGSQCLYLMDAGLTILPEMGVSVDSLAISFHNFNPGPGIYYLVLGVCDSNTEGCEASFVAVDTIWNTHYDEWFTSHALVNYTGTGRYIAIQNRSDAVNDWTGEFSNHYIDDITVDYLPSCLAPSHPHTHSAEGRPISLEWTDFGSPTQWEVSYATAPLSDPAQGTRMMAYSNPVLIPDLPEVNHYFYVRAICAPGDTSAWSSPATGTPSFCPSAEEYSNMDASLNLSSESYFPGFEYYNYSYSQMLLSASELAQAGGDIMGFKFKPTSVSNSNTLSECDIYMTNTSTTSLQSSFVTVDAINDLVAYGADLSCSDTSWQLCRFDTPFVWDGHSNVAITVNRRSGSWTSAYSQFRTMDGLGYKLRCVYRDPQAFDVNPNVGANSLMKEPLISLVVCPEAPECPTPQVDTIVVAGRQATLMLLEDSVMFGVAIRQSPSGAWSPEVVAAGNAYTFESLAYATAYEVRVRRICDAAQGRASDCVVVPFATMPTPSYIVTVQVVPEGSGFVTGAGTYLHGDTCLLTAEACAGYEFLSWNDSLQDNPLMLVVESDMKIVATFGQQQSITTDGGDQICDIYPNPTSGNVSIRLQDNASPVMVEVVDVQGRVVLGRMMVGQDILSLEQLAQGTYFVRITTGDAIHTQKLIVR